VRSILQRARGPDSSRDRRARAASLVLAALLLAGCGPASPPALTPAAGTPGTAVIPGMVTDAPDAAPSTAASTGAPATPETTAQDPRESLAPVPSGACALPPLPLRAAQVLLVGIPGTTAGEGGRSAVDAGVGGILLYGENLVDAAQVRTLVADLQARAAVPLAIATDEEPGRIGRLAGAGIIPATPSARSLGRLPTATIEARARRIGRGMADLGLTVDLAPVLDVTGAAGGGVIGDRSFGADPAVVSRAGVAFAEGLARAGIAAVGKHFPGHGETAGDSHSSLPIVTASVATLRRRALPPFEAAIGAGIPAIMLGHLRVDAIDPFYPTSLSAKAVRLLREDLGFTGLVMADDLYMGGVTDRWDVPTAVELALRAGVDMVVLSTAAGVREVTASLVAAVDGGRLPETRLNDAFLRVQRFKGVDRWTACEP
jgi:beta-N-acetylhexosaminidase